MACLALLWRRHACYLRPVRNPYDVLGVERSATQEEIKGAFRKLASQHHPDKNPDDESAHNRFKEINAAYQILSDPDKRAAFDRFGNAAFNRPGGGPGPAGVQGIEFDFSDLHIDGIFGDLLGALGIKVGGGGNLQKDIRISFEEAAFGCTKELTYDRIEPCADCHGSGAAPGSAPERCTMCQGRGRVRVQQGVLPIAFEKPCTRCHGKGSVVSNPCTHCRGAGLVSKPRTIEITIPAGVENGATRVVERAGNSVRADRNPGDLELTIRVSAHELFKRVGDDILCAMPISFAQAALGGEIEIPTLEGTGKLRIPPGTQPGTVLRVRGKGIPRRSLSGRGDQLVEVNVEVPTKLSDRQKEMIAQLAEALGENVQPQQASFMEKLRSLFG